MDCEDARPLLEPYHDEALELAERRVVEAHLATCPACRSEIAALRSLSGLLQTHARLRAPEGLAARVRAALPVAGGAPASARPGRRALTAGLAACLASAGLGVWIGRGTTDPSERDLIARDVLHAHQRALAAPVRIDVASADPHTVKPWLTGRLGFAPPMGDPATRGFVLDGARIDHVDGTAVAALTLHRRQHVVSLFVWPAEGAPASEPASLRRQGFSLVTWQADGFSFWAISDLNERELRELAGTEPPL